MDKDYIILEWDTKFFGYPVAKMLPPTFDHKKIVSLLEDLKKRKIHLAVWHVANLSLEQLKCLIDLGATSVGQRITFRSNPIEQLGPPSLNSMVSEYLDKTACKPLLSLAIQSGRFSRFNKDPLISQRKFEELYSLWIERSVNHTISDAVFVARENSEIIGTITVAKNLDQGKIGLLCVDEKHHGKGAGTSLVTFANAWFYKMGLHVSEVVTQGENTSACRLYEKCGYHLVKSETSFHFWLANPND